MGYALLAQALQKKQNPQHYNADLLRQGIKKTRNFGEMYSTYNVDVLIIFSEGAGVKAGAAIAAAAIVASVTVITKDLDQIPNKVGKGGD